MSITGLFSVTLISISFASSCSVSGSWHTIDDKITWTQAERTGLKNGDRLISQYLDSKSKSGESFYLYYFTKEFPLKPEHNDYTGKTILFCAGGPGQNVANTGLVDKNGPPTLENLADIPGYRVVYFHLRGSGFSQIPEPRIYDNYLRTRYAVEDIERIRIDLLGERGQWAAVLGYSYGTVLAQQYAHEHPESLKKLILIGPLSRHQLGAGAYAGVAKEKGTDNGLPALIRNKDLQTLKMIYAKKGFRSLLARNPKDENLVDLILKEVSQRLIDIENNYGGLPGLIDFYPELYARYQMLDPSARQAQAANLFEYNLPFFRALREIRLVGWAPGTEDQRQQMIGAVVAEEVFRVKNFHSLETKLNNALGPATSSKPFCESIPSGDDIDKELKAKQKQFNFKIPPGEQQKIMQREDWSSIARNLCQARVTFAEPGSTSAKRVFYVMTVYDGLDMDILEHLAAGGLDIETVRAPRSNLLPVPMNWIYRKIAPLIGETPRPWDPARFEHNKPTLIIKGGADSVSVGDAAEHFFNEALTGKDKMLIEFAGVGHRMTLPVTQLGNVSRDEFTPWPGCNIQGGAINDPKPCLLDMFISDKFDRNRWENLLQLIGQQLCRDAKKQGLENESLKKPVLMKPDGLSNMGNCS